MTRTRASDDTNRAALHWQELKAAKDEDAEIERYKKLQERPKTRAEAEHDADLHRVRMRMLKGKRTAREKREREDRTARLKKESDETVEGSAVTKGKERTETLQSPENGVEVDEDLSLPGLPFVPIPKTPPSKRERADTKFTSFAFEDSSPPPITHWRDPQRERGRLNADSSRIETQFILSDKFIDNINQMLDFIIGWPEDQFQDLKYAFEKDPENRGRKIEFVDRGSGEWGVQLLQPSRRDSGTSPQLFDSYTFEDLPDACQRDGCDEGCPRKVSFKEKAADLKKFREQQRKARSLDDLAESGILKGSSLGVLPDVYDTPPAPGPLHSRKRKTPDGFPSTGGLSSASTLECPASPRPRNLPFPTAASISENVQKLENQLKQVKESLAGTKQTSLIDPRDAVKELLRQTKQQITSPDTMINDRAVDKMESRSPGHKLVHQEKVPAGPGSIPTEAYRQNLALATRSVSPKPVESNIRMQPRDNYPAVRAPPPTPLFESEDCVAKAGDQDSSSSTPRIKFRPQYEKHPDEY